MAGCVTIIAALLVIIGFPYLVLWFINLNRSASGYPELPYDLTNWLYVIGMIALFVMIKIILYRYKLKRKCQEEQRHDTK